MNTIILYKIIYINTSWELDDVERHQQFLGTYRQAQIWIKKHALEEEFDSECAKSLYASLDDYKLRGTTIEAGESNPDEFYMVEEIHLKKSELLREIFNGTNDDLEKMFRQILVDVGESYGSQNDIIIHEVMNTLIKSLEEGKYEPIE